MKKLLLFLIVFIVQCFIVTNFSPPALAATPTFYAKSSSNGSSSWQHTVNNNANRILIVGSAGNPSSITFNGIALTKLNISNMGTQTSMWYLVNPPVGTYTISMSSAANAGAVSYYNVDPLNPIAQTKGTSGSFTFISIFPASFNPSLTLSGTTTNQVVVDTVGWGSGGIAVGAGSTASQNSGQTQLWLGKSGSGNSGGSSYKAGGNGSTSVGWAVTLTRLNGIGGGNWSYGALVLNAAPVPTPTPTATPTPTNVCVSNTTDIVIVLDHSKSMADQDFYGGKSKITSAIEETNTFIDKLAQLSPGTRIGVLQFAGNYQYPNRYTATGIVAPISTNYAQTKTAVSKIMVTNDPNGYDDGTCIECGLDMANTMFQSANTPSNRRLAILITDGQANEGTDTGWYFVDSTIANPLALAKSVEGVVSYNIIYRTIGVGTGTQIDETVLRQIGAGAGGKYYNDPNNGTLNQIYSAILAYDFPCQVISGNIFRDNNKNGMQDTGENNYNGTVTVTASKGTVATNASGTYTVSGLAPGTAVTVSASNFPSGYTVTYPLNGPPPSFNVTVGTACNTNGATGAVCSGGNISNLNFGINNQFSWYQSVCGGIRVDDGITSEVPSTAASPYLITTNSSCSDPGVAITGDSFSDFGAGNPSVRNWVVGGTSYPEVYSPSTIAGVSTSYAALNAKAQKTNATITDLTTVCSLTSCTLPATLAHGIYRANGDVTLNAFTVPANKNYVFLVNGNLLVKGAISVPTTSTAIFTASGNITVDPTLGVAPSSTTSSLDGIYSTDKSFILPSAGSCTDQRLNIAGNLIINASQTTGTLQNFRDLCTNNVTYPSMSITQRLDFLLSLPDFIRSNKIQTSESIL